MEKWKLILAAMKPDRIVFAHTSFWIGIAWFLLINHSVTLFQLTQIPLFLYFYGNMYIINDLADRKRDAGDVVNKDRLIASGKLSARDATMAVLINFTITLSLAWLINPLMFYSFLALIVINVIYSFFLKNIPYVDLVWISLTQGIKFFLAMLILAPTSISQIAGYLPIMAILYFLGIEFHGDKQRGKLAYGMKRKYLIGTCTDYGLLLLQRIAAFFLLGMIILYYREPIVIFVSVPIILLEIARMLFPKFSTNYFFKVQGIIKKASKLVG